MQFMVCTGRHHGFESLEEQRLLLVLDFLQVAQVLVRPSGWRSSTSAGVLRIRLTSWRSGRMAAGGCWTSVRGVWLGRTTC